MTNGMLLFIFSSLITASSFKEVKPVEWSKADSKTEKVCR